MENPIARAYEALNNALKFRDINDIKITIHDKNWLRINAVTIQRTLWIGYREGYGYFSSWEQIDNNEHYFENISDILELLSPALNGLTPIYNNIDKSTNTVIESVIRFKIDDKWLVTDLIMFCTSIKNIYTIFTIKDNVTRSIDEIERHLAIPLQIKQIQYASPGQINFKGLGEPIKELKDLFESFVLIVQKWRQAKLELAAKQREIQAKDLELEQKALQIEKEKQENALAIKKAEAEILLDLEMKGLELIDKKIDVMKKLNPDVKLDNWIEHLKQNLLNLAPLIEQGKLLPAEQENT